jgi:hypothetical protein
MEALAHKIDVFNGVQVDSDALSPDAIEFGEKLQGKFEKSITAYQITTKVSKYTYSW